jgi:hypothetical protein
MNGLTHTLAWYRSGGYFVSLGLSDMRDRYAFSSPHGKNTPGFCAVLSVSPPIAKNRVVRYGREYAGLDVLRFTQQFGALRRV